MTRGDLNHHRQSVHAAAASHNGRVKMGDWNFLGGILEEVHIHSTMVGKIWLTILFIFRMLVLGVAAEEVWNDEQSDFLCNTEQPGCRNVCYDQAFPISLIRYWVLQVIFVSSPSLVYMGHALYRLRALEKTRQRKKAVLRRELETVDLDMAEARKRIEREMKLLDQGKLNKAPLRGSLLRTYVAHVVTRSVVEVVFMGGQYLLYGFSLQPLFRCERDPCPNAVDCYVSRPTEKSIFMVFMQSIAAISLSLNILEILHLGYKKIKKGILDFYPHLRDDRDDLDHFYSNRYKKESVVQICSVPRKSTMASAPSDFNLLTERVQGPPSYPNIIKSPTFLSLQGELAARHDLDESKCSAQSPPQSNCTETPNEPGSPGCLGPPMTPNETGSPGCLGPPKTPNEPGSPFCLGPPKTPNEPGSPGCLGPPKTPNEPGSPGCLGPPKTPNEPGSPGFLVHPKTPNEPGSPGCLGPPKTPNEPGSPGCLGPPKTPNEPGSPGCLGPPKTPNEPGSPGFLGPPKTPNEPGSLGFLGPSKTPNEPGSPGCLGPPKLQDFVHRPPHSERGSPDSPKCPQKTLRRPRRSHGSLKCSTVLEGRSSDTDSCDGAGCPPPTRTPTRTQPKSDRKQQSSESLEESSSGSRHNHRPPSSNGKTSGTSSNRRVTDLQI